MLTGEQEINWAWREAEANAFAMELLMPTDFLLRDLKQMGGIDLADDVQVGKLAKKYRVAVSLMAIRIGQLLP
jgi:Zn-dependent peptidase ImmA (M78 family)